ncbi:MAG: hypothetical protein ACK56F_18450, partial [bacterium]
FLPLIFLWHSAFKLNKLLNYGKLQHGSYNIAEIMEDSLFLTYTKLKKCLNIKKNSDKKQSLHVNQDLKVAQKVVMIGLSNLLYD